MRDCDERIELMKIKLKRIQVKKQNAMSPQMMGGDGNENSSGDDSSRMDPRNQDSATPLRPQDLELEFERGIVSN
jgi:hypothetical protein